MHGDAMPLIPSVMPLFHRTWDVAVRRRHWHDVLRLVAYRRLATGGGLAGQWQTSLSLLAMPRRMGIVTARSLGDSNGLACLGWLATACRGQLRHNVRNNKIIKIIDKSVNVCL